jgi:hypothetical protein
VKLTCTLWQVKRVADEEGALNEPWVNFSHQSCGVFLVDAPIELGTKKVLSDTIPMLVLRSRVHS